MTFFRQCSPGRLLEVKQGTLQLTISLWTVDSPSVLHPDGMFVQDVYTFRRSIFRFQAIERPETGQNKEESQVQTMRSVTIDIHVGDAVDIPADYLYSDRHQSGRKRLDQPSLAVSMS